MDKRQLALFIYRVEDSPEALLDFIFVTDEEEEDCFSGYINNIALIDLRPTEKQPWEIRISYMERHNFDKWIAKKPKFLGNTNAEILRNLELEEIQCLLKR